jgi:hypothetical protein
LFLHGEEYWEREGRKKRELGGEKKKKEERVKLKVIRG